MNKGAHWGLQNTVNDVTTEVLQTVQQFIEVNERTFSLHVGVLGQVAPCPRLLSTVGLRKAKDVTHGRYDGLQVQLRRLG